MPPRGTGDADLFPRKISRQDLSTARLQQRVNWLHASTSDNDSRVSNTNEIGLGEMIADLRRELEGALIPPTQKGLRFELKDIDLELQVQVTRKTSGEASGKFSFKVLDFVSVEAGGGGSHSRESGHSHTFRLKLKPEVVGEDGKARSLLVNDEIEGKGIEPKMPTR